MRRSRIRLPKPSTAAVTERTGRYTPHCGCSSRATREPDGASSVFTADSIVESVLGDLEVAAIALARHAIDQPILQGDAA